MTPHVLLIVPGRVITCFVFIVVPMFNPHQHIRTIVMNKGTMIFELNSHALTFREEKTTLQAERIVTMPVQPGPFITS